MKKFALLCALLLFVAIAAGGTLIAAGSAAPGSAAGSRASAVCSKATAERLIAENRLNIFALPKPLSGNPLCGPFTGPGSQAMAVMIAAPTCWPVQSWAVFSLTGGVWKLVLSQPAYLIPPLVAVGSDIRETTPVSRPGDSRCLPSGGTHTRLWHWNGSRLVAGAWKQLKAPAAGRTMHLLQFQSPSHNIVCREGGDEDLVYCASYKLPHSASMNTAGNVTICTGRACLGGATAPGPAASAVPVLAYGDKDDDIFYRCKSETKGVTCTVRTGKASGKGFLINAAGVTKVGP